MFSIQQLTYFVTVSKRGSLSAAAKELDVTVQAVSRGLIEFERQFQEDLFVRRSHGVELTAFGCKLYYKAKDVLAGVSDLTAFASSSGNKAQEELSLMLCSPSFATKHIVNKHIVSFVNKSIDIEPHVTLGSRDACINALFTGSIDAFITLGTTELPLLDVLQVGTVSTGALLMEFADLAKKSSVTLDDFADRPLCVSPQFDFFFQTVRDELSERHPDVRLDISEPTLLDVYRVLARERGCFVVPAIPEFGELFPGAVICPFAPEDAVDIPICLVSKKDDKSPAYVSLERSLAKIIPSIRGIGDELFR